MISELLRMDGERSSPAPKEADLYKIIKLFGKTFEIRYGYYEERDRHNLYAEPMEIYPDFIEDPLYTEDGIPFVTAIQNPCDHFEGKKDENSTCEECRFYQHGEELLGICTCPDKQQNVRNVMTQEG